MESVYIIIHISDLFVMDN